ncbi:MAG TPA: aminopeptidase P family protein [Propionicimonas sp.]|uniref:aminopeptidase P family protein n=1 Tax=Propionicimonas sp. TaxID=1955623 RepID=UPI002F421A6A
MTEESTQTEAEALPNRAIPFSEAFREFIPTAWAPYPTELPSQLAAAGPAALRRRALAEAHPGERLVIPAGGFKVRANDTDYRFRPHSAFAWLTGLGTDREPDSVLVLEPTDTGHEATLYFKPRAPRTDPEFYADSRYGEMWVGTRESLAEMTALTGISCAPVSELDAALAKNVAATTVRLLAEADEVVSRRIGELRAEAGVDLTAAAEGDAAFLVALSEARLIKDDYELGQLRQACTDTAVGFEAVVADLPEAVRRGRGERWVEGVFGLHARHQANAIGYDTIAASGDHANTLHWIRNDGDVRPDDLLLMDAGVEVESLYTADITRTLPVSGTFSPAQRKVYEAVLAAQEAGIAAAKPGNRFSDVHKAAVAVIAEHLEAWGLLPVTAAESLDPERGGHHRRWMVHGTSHHLGLDVHDCAQARQENYRDAELRPGMVITVEPGLYFKATDLLVPEELRGIGVRIEDDIAITADGNEILSSALPREAEAVEAWMAAVRER